jgi:hypothetical protein
LGVPRCVLKLGWHRAGLLYMGETIVLHLEHVGAKILAEAITGAVALFDPDSHLKTPLQ